MKSGLRQRPCWYTLSRVSTHITTASPSAPGLAIDPKYLSHPFNIEVLVRHVQQLDTNLRTEPLASYSSTAGNVYHRRVIPCLDEAREIVRQKAVSAHHRSGTCLMTPRELGGVVNEKLRVYGCKRLRVYDFSIVPLMIRSTPQATVFGIAEHGSQTMQSGS